MLRQLGPELWVAEAPLRYPNLAGLGLEVGRRMSVMRLGDRNLLVHSPAPLDEPLHAAVAQAAEDVAGRVGVRLRLDLEEDVDVPPSTREGLVRIVREAVSNTARHGRAKCATVELSGGGGVRLRISDDGIGFDTDDRTGHGFGLTSMSERARALGGELHISSTPGAGTEIEVVLP